MTIMTTFPLYNEIKKKIPEDLTDMLQKDKEYIVENIKNFDKTQYEYVYLLVMAHYAENNLDGNKINTLLPYSLKKNKQGVKIDLDKLPLKLQYIVGEFVKMNFSGSNN